MNYNLTKSEWNKLSAEQKASLLYNYTDAIKELTRYINTAKLECSKLAHSIKKHKLYKNYWDSEEKTKLSSYLEQAKIPISKKDFNRLSDDFKLHLMGIPIGGIIQLSTYKKNLLHTLGEELSADWVDKAINLSSSDLKREIDEFKGKYKNPTKCEHTNIKVHSKQKYKCEDCGEIFSYDPNKHNCENNE